LLLLLLRKEVGTFYFFKRLILDFFDSRIFVELVDEHETILTSGKEELCILIEASCSEMTNRDIVILDRHSSFEVALNDSFYLTISVSDNDDLTLVISLLNRHGSHQSISFGAGDCLKRSLCVQVANIHETTKSSLSGHQIILLTILGIEWNDSP
jgi:hypothetical protein